MMVGLVTPNSGDIFLNDIKLTRIPMYKRARLGVGYLAQEASVFRNLTVLAKFRIGITVSVVQ